MCTTLTGNIRKMRRVKILPVELDILTPSQCINNFSLHFFFLSLFSAKFKWIFCYFYSCLWWYFANWRNISLSQWIGRLKMRPWRIKIRKKVSTEGQKLCVREEFLCCEKKESARERKINGKSCNPTSSFVE